MDHCKYHPLKASTYHCSACHLSVCDSCVDEIDHEIRCVRCGERLDSLGAGANIEPFWRRLDLAFRYPMNTQVLMLILGASVLSAVGAFIGGLIGFILSILVAGVTTKFSFLCLQQTADGSMRAPMVTEAYSGGVKMIIHIIAIFLAIGLMMLAVSKTFGDFVTTAFAMFWLFSLPAVFINYARFESIGAAINPIELIRLVCKLGRSYLLLLVFLLIMIASVATLNQLFSDFYFFSNILESITSYYYLIVIFHLMGYLLFQKQRALGFASRFDEDEMQIRTDKLHFMDKVEVLTKEGRFEDVSYEFKEGIKRFPKELDIFNRYFDYLCAIQNSDDTSAFLPAYLECLKQSNRESLIPVLIQRVYQYDPGFKLKDPSARHEIAKHCFEAGKHKLTIKLLNGLHREFPQYEGKVQACELMADALEAMPGKAQQAEKFREMAAKMAEV
ncbi:B-box zinc finger protein [Neptuniibacter sp. PT8_73]|uniref:B-box zinc finger protein n=1 Tax=unclassified Neptuniibacter TaxID=2630693 RepID=UPI0039F73924